MTMHSLKEVFHDRLQGDWSASKQSLEVVTALGRAAIDKELSEAFIWAAFFFCQIQRVFQVCGGAHKFKAQIPSV